MAGGFSIGVAADTRAFESGVKAGIIEPVEDAQDALQDLARSGDKAGDGLSRGTRDGELSLGKLGKAGKDAGDDIDRGARDAGRALDQLGRDGKDAGDDLEQGLKGAQKETRTTAADYRAMTDKIEAETAKIKRQSRESFEGAGAGTAEFKEEALSNFSEVTSSFTGDMTSITDLAQGTFGGLASIGGPASLAFGGVAVAVGLIGQALTTAGEESDEFKEKVKELAQTKLGDLLGEYDDSGDELARGLRKWATDADSFNGSIEDLRKNTKQAKLPFGELADAIATQSVPKMKEMRREVEAQIKSLDRQAGAQRAAGNGSSALANKLGEQGDAARAVKKQLDDNLEVNDQYEKSLRSVAKAQGLTVAEYKAQLEATQQADEAAQSFADTMSSTLAAAAESTSEALDNAAMDASKYIKGLEERTAAAQQYQTNVQAIGEQLPADLFNFVREQGPGFSEEIATYLAASPEQQARIQAAWKIDAQVTGDTRDLDATTDKKSKETKKGPTSKVQGDTKDLDEKVTKKSQQKSPGPTSKLRADTDAVDKAMERLKQKTFQGPTAHLRVDESSVNSAISRLRNTVVTVKVKAVDG